MRAPSTDHLLHTDATATNPGSGQGSAPNRAFHRRFAPGRAVPGLLALLLTGLGGLQSEAWAGEAVRLAAAATEAAAGRPTTDTEFQTVGVVGNLPVFTDRIKARIHHPMSWTSGAYRDFGEWRRLVRAKVRSSFLNPPPEVPWKVAIIGEEDRGTHVARKLVFDLTGDSRVLAYLTLPKGQGPFPAVLLLHDHGGRYDIGKEKVVRPWGDLPERAASAAEWVGRNYGGRYLADELAARGYVCFATDALNWGDRGGGQKLGQNAIASNLMHLGMSFAGLIAWEDLRAAEFLAQQPEVDPQRIASMGLSMGSFRAWQIAAISDRIAAGVAVCWMGTVKTMMVPGNNQVTGQSAFAFLHPGLLDQLDYSDIASIACPKPMLFYNGAHDALFPQEGVQNAFAKLRAVWSSQGAAERLETRTWDIKHLFNVEMQEAAFAWLDAMLRKQ